MLNLRKNNTVKRVKTVNWVLFLIFFILFVAYIIGKNVFPTIIVGGENTKIKNNYKIQVNDKIETDGANYKYVFDNGNDCSQHYPLGAPKVRGRNLSEKSALFCYAKYAVHYDTQTKTPIWESHVLNRKDFVGQDYVERTNDFREDHNIAGQPVSSKPSEYRGTNYDKGHLAPAADFSYDKNAMSESFYMTNIAPQAPMHNRQIWSKLEQAVRKLAKHKNIEQLYVTTGIIYHKEGNFGDEKGTLGQFHNIKIPTYFFKIIIEPKTAQSAAYLIPNTNHVGNQPFSNFLIKISDLEKVAKINFNPDLDKKLVAIIEKKGGTLDQSLSNQ